jgi:hypothetical protein
VNPPEMMNLLSEYSGLLPGLVVTVVAGLLLGRPVGRRLGVRGILGFALVMGFGIALSATVTPSHEALEHGIRGSGTCDIYRTVLPSRYELAWPGEALLNILLFVPLGMAIGLCPPSRAKLVVVGLAYALPFAVEAIQLVVVQLGRECQSADVVDNLVGLTLAIAAANLVRWTASAIATWLRRERGPGPDPDLPPAAP